LGRGGLFGLRLGRGLLGHRYGFLLKGLRVNTTDTTGLSERSIAACKERRTKVHFRGGKTKNPPPGEGGLLCCAAHGGGQKPTLIFPNAAIIFSRSAVGSGARKGYWSETPRRC